MIVVKKSSKVTRCTIWTKLILAVVPSIVFGVFTIIFTLQQNSFSAAARDQDQQQAFEQRKEYIFDNCIGAISEFLLTPDFNRSSAEHLQPIQAKVLTALRRLDLNHRRDIIFYLYANKLIRNDIPPEFRLNLRGADLNGVHFVSSSKSRCDLKHLHLPGILASNIVFSGCDLDEANFEGSVMDQSRFYNCSLGHVEFLNVDLQRAVFQNNIYWSTSFAGSSLVQSSFVGPNVLYFIDWSNTDLFRSDITNERLFGPVSPSITSIVRNLRLPNGTLMIYSPQLVKDGGAEKECTRTSDLPTPWSMDVTAELILTHRYVENSSVFPPPTEGNCYFLAKKKSLLGQNVDLKPLSRLIDTGQVSCNVSVYLGCSQSHPSNQVALSFGFLDEHSWPMDLTPRVLTTIKSAFEFQSRIASIPTGTRAIAIRLSANIHNPSTLDNPPYCALDDIKVFIFDNKNNSNT